MARTRSFIFLLLQLSAFCGLFWLCGQLATLGNLPIPAGVIGLAVLVTLLLTRTLPEQAVLSGSQWLLGDLLLFFVPSVVSIIKYWVLILDEGWMLVATLILGTVIVLTGTAWVVDRIFTLEQRFNDRHRADAAHV